MPETARHEATHIRASLVTIRRSLVTAMAASGAVTDGDLADLARVQLAIAAVDAVGKEDAESKLRERFPGVYGD